MVTIYDLKPRFQALLRPLATVLVRAGATANGLTLAALGLSIAAGSAGAAPCSTNWVTCWPTRPSTCPCPGVAGTRRSCWPWW